jgi:hypothetical protein
VIVKRYTAVLRTRLDRGDSPFKQLRVGWYLFGAIPLYIADL